ncbi:hypothetical protein MHYP_G00325490 [Metynnis hypsauchen]
MYSEFTSILHLIAFIHIEGSLGQTHWTVRCDEGSICASRGSTVFLNCSYSLTNIQTVVWFSHKQKAKWRREEHPEDLALDSDYAGRVDYVETKSSTCLIIRDVREKDSGEYRLLLFTTTGQKYFSSTAVNLTVTDIQVRTHGSSVAQREQGVNLTCSTSCKLNIFWCTWYKNGQRVQLTLYQNAEPLVLSSTDGGSYSCSINDHGNTVYSSAVCVLGKNCFSVTYADRRVCALEGSSVNIPCSYSYPSDQAVIETYWSYNHHDMRQSMQFTGRVKYAGDKNKNCALRLTGLRQNDSGNYRFSFMTKTAPSIFIGSPGVQLTVTSMEVRVSSATVSGQTVTLSCRTTCSLNDDTTYIWYKNGQPMTNKVTKYNKLYLDLPSYKKTDNYTCVVRGAKVSVGDVWDPSAIWGTVGVMALLPFTLTAVLYIRRKRRPEGHACSQSRLHPEDDTYTALNTETTSSDYYTLRPRTASTSNLQTTAKPAAMSANDTGVYTALQRRAPEAEYETLKRKQPAGT